MAAYVEMHGHGTDQSVAIIWVILNRVAGTNSILGGTFHPNSNFSGINLIAGYVLTAGQFALGKVIFDYGLLEEGESGNYEIVGEMTLQEVIEESFNRLNDRYEGALDDFLSIVNQVIDDYNSGAPDPTNGAVFYGHIPPQNVQYIQSYLEEFAESNGVSSELAYVVFQSERPINPRYLIVNNLTWVP